MASSARQASVVDETPAALNSNLGWLLSRTSYILTTELTAGLEKLGLSPRAQCVLKAALHGERTQTELAREIGLDKTTMVVTVDELEAAGLAERKLSKHDRRARVIGVTPAGRRKLRQAEEISARIQHDVLGELPAREREALLNGLCRLVSGRLSEPVECSQAVRRRAPRG